MHTPDQTTPEPSVYGKVYKDANGRPLKPLKNEIVSRDQMQKTPPHILVTNYAMLEYMMLRPKDDLVFSRAKLRFLVLDEAHIYRGATGMETSLLLKRLKARISNPANVLHILTSATLGGKEADDDIVKFAETLCNASFYAEDIIRSQSVVPSYDREPVDVPLSMFAELIDPQKPLNVIADDYGLPIPDGIPDAEYLYDLCVSASVYRDLRRITSHPMTIPEITRALRATHNVTQQDVVNIIGVAAQASKNKSALIKARYHMFAKALEGAYVTLGQNKKLMLNRNRSITIGDENWKVFECAICDDCGRVAVAGKEVDGKLEFANSSYDPEIEYYLLRDSRDIDLDLDEEDEDDTEEIGKNDYILCSKCGALIHESLKADPPCTCGLTHYVKLRKARKSGSRGDGKCPSCNFGTFKTFYLGYDAATAVLGTSLFEELPESEKVLKSKKSAQPVKKSLFGAAKQGAQVDIVRRKRQFLSFSDSRGEAAFFASYMTAAYSEFLRRRGIWHVVEKNNENMAAHPWEIQHFVDELTSYFDSCRTFAEPGDKGVENLTATSRKNAWIAVLNEMVNARRSTSLASLGILKFNYKGNAEEIMSGVAEAYQQKVEDVKALFDLLAMEIVYFSCSNYVKDYRGTCLTRHYIRADAVEAVVEMELRRLAEYLIADENRFAEILARRSIKQVESEKKTVQSELRKSEMRIEIIPKLLKTLYEDKLSGKTSEDNYCVLSQEYSDEREQLQKKILKLRRKLTEIGEKENEREEFIHAIRKFMEMRTLTKQVLNELIDHIDVYETQGTGKNKTQRLVIYYKFVGYLDIDPTQCHPNYTADIREGVAIEYVSCEPLDSLKELFSEGYNADDDSFEEEEMEQA